MRKFKHLNVPEQWQHYWSKYPQGYTILEALLNWVHQVDEMVDSYNTLTDRVNNFKDQVNSTTDEFREELDSFLNQFDDNLKGEVIDILSQWQADGTLDIVISEALQTQIDEVDERLSEQMTQSEQQTNAKLNLKGWELQNKTREHKPTFAIINDDGYKGNIDKLIEITDYYNIPYTEAIIGKNVRSESDPDYNPDSISMSLEKLYELQEKGHEIAPHTWNHNRLTNMSISELEQDFSTMDAKMNEWGFHSKAFVYPFGARNDDVINVAKKYYRAGRPTQPGILGYNLSPINTWDLSDMAGHNLGERTTQEAIDFYKGKIDEMIEDKGLGLFTTHVYMDNDEIDILWAIVPYLLARGVEIVTFSQALDRFSNIVDIGRKHPYDLKSKHLTIGFDGEFSSSDFHNIVQITPTNRNNIVYDEVDFYTPPSYFEFGKIYHSVIHARHSEGFPQNRHGKLVTNTTESNVYGYGAYVTQTYEVLRRDHEIYGKNKTYKRHATGEDTWSDFELDNPEVLEVYLDWVPTFTTPLEDFPNNVKSYIRLSSSQATGFPRHGLLMTNRIMSGGRQELYTNERYDTFVRYFEQGAWTVFRKVMTEPI